MKQAIKRIIKPLIPLLVRNLKRNYSYAHSRNMNLSKLGTIIHTRPVNVCRELSREEEFAKQFKYMCAHITWNDSSYYVYPYDPKIVRLVREGIGRLASITVDFGRILDSDIDEILKELDKGKDTFGEVERICASSILRLSERISEQLATYDKNRQKELSGYFQTICHRQPTSLDEALQKLLFFNALFWQAGHFHIGLGRLDMILYPYYENDINRGKINRNEAKAMLKEFCRVLGSQTINKSLSLIGDTGQYILLGGCDKHGETIQNELTEIFLEIFTEQHFPDPKLILRVNKNTSTKIWLAATECISTGCGSPLIMNEEPVMKSMVQFGYQKEDVWNVGTSACWEPLIIGKSFDQNNPLPSINLVKVLNETLASNEEFDTFDALLKSYLSKVGKEIKSIAKDITFDCSPLFSLFFDDCLKLRKDFSEGGARYSHHGMQAIGLPNAVNGLLNIEKIVYKERLFTLSEIKKALDANFNDSEDILALMLANPMKFGRSDKNVIELTNLIMSHVGNEVSKLTVNGTKPKVGFSSPNYINSGKRIGASADGRKKGEPLAVHISPASSDIDIAEIMDFATQLNYSDNRINGNVVDFIVPSSYVKNQEKLVSILRDACDRGVFELQLNVLDAATLKDAKAHPDKYPDLIVRVWGFSAYFNDLPEEYKDNLIRRAETYA